MYGFCGSSLTSYCFQTPPARWLSLPPKLANQTPPCRSSHTDWMVRPSESPWRSNSLGLTRFRPPLSVPTQSVPSRSTHRDKTVSCDSPFLLEIWMAAPCRVYQNTPLSWVPTTRLPSLSSQAVLTCDASHG